MTFAHLSTNMECVWGTMIKPKIPHSSSSSAAVISLPRPGSLTYYQSGNALTVCMPSHCLPEWKLHFGMCCSWNICGVLAELWKSFNLWELKRNPNSSWINGTARHFKGILDPGLNFKLEPEKFHKAIKIDTNGFKSCKINTIIKNWKQYIGILRWVVRIDS